MTALSRLKRYLSWNEKIVDEHHWMKQNTIVIWLELLVPKVQA